MAVLIGSTVLRGHQLVCFWSQGPRSWGPSRCPSSIAVVLPVGIIPLCVPRHSTKLES